MSVNTNANIVTIPGFPETTKVNTGGGGLTYMTVEIGGDRLPVQTRYDSRTGESAAVVIVEKEVTTKVSTRSARASNTVTRTIEEPIVLYTIDQDGNRTLGGSGTSDVKGVLGGGSEITTTSAEATSFIGTLEIDGSSATQDDLFTEHDKRTNALYESTRRDIRRGAATTTVQGVTPVAATTGAGITPPVDQGKEATVDDDGQRPENNFGSAFGEAASSAVSFIGTKVSELASAITISAEDIEKFENTIQGEGDNIVSAFYPFDNTYGQFAGQDYVTIDQFRYKSPRRNQIFAFESKDENGNVVDKGPINNLKGSLRSSPLKEFIAQVKLPMPNDIQDGNTVGWGADHMNNITAAIVSGTMQNPALVGGAAVAGNMLGGEAFAKMAAMAAIGAGSAGFKFDNLDAFIGSAKKGLEQAQAAVGGSQGKVMLGTTVGSAILNAAGVQVSPESILSRGIGIIPNSNMERLFNGVALRDFNFSWKMSPRDEEEAKQVKAIIRFFKQGMAARTIKNTAGERSLFLGTPNIFRLQYRTSEGKIIEGVNRIKPCAITGTSVNYTPDGVWSAYDEGQPVSTILSIRMEELEPVYASDYTQNNIANERRSNDVGGRNVEADIGKRDGDLYSIRPTEVGY